MNTKTKTTWSCAECGHHQAKWAGRCPQCGQWNTLHEEVTTVPLGIRFGSLEKTPTKAIRLSEIVPSSHRRHLTQLGEFDRLMGGGLVRGSFSLLSGDPGIGKSTLLLQVSAALEHSGQKVLYVCGEESVEQTYDRAQRLGITGDNLFFLSETEFSLIRAQIQTLKPDVLIVDSIQIVYKGEIPSAPGSVTQVRETATEFMHLAKGQHLTTLLVGHVTKGGDIAGPRVLEHLVDTVLYFEGDRHQDYRLLRAVKNRFGATDELALFRMSADGLVEVPNPSEILLQERSVEGTGSVVIPTVEGTRPLLIEVQSLVTPTAYPNPSRRCTGLDSNRLSLLLAVMEKRLRFRLHTCDVFVSVAGGMRTVEPSVDLGVLMAIASSFSDQAVPSQLVAMGEVGLGGEVRSVSKIELRIKEAARMGFARAIIPERNLKSISESLRSQIELVGIEHVEQAIDQLSRH